jgi:outer membrane protein assembly factor BamB/predicted Ser/Thr protein kinase
MKPLGNSDPIVVAAYRLLGVLGHGGMGRVYLGVSREGRRLAIKVIRPELAEDPVFRRRFAREVTAMRAVSPLFTAAVVDADTDAAAPWLATAYIDGPSLERRVTEQGPMSLDAALALAAGLANALAAIHRVGLVHRDLKPSNVLLDDAGVHIIDFGIALSPNLTRMTNSVLVGTPSYMAPERLQGGKGTPAGDVFALGATLFFAIAGRELVNGSNPYIKIMQVTEGRFNLSATPKEIRPLIVRCINSRPKDRPTAGELALILAAIGVPTVTPGWYRVVPPVPPGRATVPAQRKPDAPSTSGWPRRRVLAIGGLLGGSVVGAGVGMFAGRRGNQRANRPAPSRLMSSAPPPAPGDVLWRGRSGSRPTGVAAGGRDSGLPIIVDRERIITARAAEVVALDVRGNTAWTRSLGDGDLHLYQWTDAVLVACPAWLRLLDAATGTELLSFDAASAEPSGNHNARSGSAQIGRIALSASRAFLNAGAATIAIDRNGRQLWRNPRPPAVGALAPSSGTPLEAGEKWLVTHDVIGLRAHVALWDAATGAHQWSTEYQVSSRSLLIPTKSDPPPADGAWRLSEARIGDTHVVMRDEALVQALRISDGVAAWQTSSQTPVAAIELVGDLVLVSSDHLTAYSVANGEEVWRLPLHGARVAVSASGGTVIAATERTISAVDVRGRGRWQVPLPDEVAHAMPDRLTTGDHVAFVTFRARPGRHEPLDVDVLAIALDA